MTTREARLESLATSMYMTYVMNLYHTEAEQQDHEVWEFEREAFKTLSDGEQEAWRGVARHVRED